MSILEPSKSCRAIRYSVIPIRKYKQLSPGINHNKAEVTSKIIDLKKCEQEILPNMELRKELVKIKKESAKDNIYSRNQRWQQKKIEKLNEKRWDMQVFELSTCTFTPSLYKKHK